MVWSELAEQGLFVVALDGVGDGGGEVVFTVEGLQSLERLSVCHGEKLLL